MLQPRFHFLLLISLGMFVACTSIASPEASNRDLLYEDTFDANASGQWRTEADESGSTSLSDSAMLIEINAPNVLQYTVLEGQQFSEYDLGIDVTFLSSNPAGTLGVLTRMVSPDDFIRFEITSDGRYMVERFNPDGTWTRFLDDWEPSPAIIAGYGAVNRLKVVASSTDLSFFVNDELLHKLTDMPVSSGQIGLDAGTFGEPGTRASFDNLTITRP